MKNQTIKKLFSGAILSLKSTDLILFFMAVGASSLSLILIASLYKIGSIASMRPVLIQMITSGLGIVIALFISNVDYHKIAKMWKFIAAVACSFSLLLFFPMLGSIRGGNNFSGAETGSDNLNWINLGFTNLQPSEFLKIAFIITFAFHCSMACSQINKPKTFIKLIAHAMAPVLIIFLQKDYGTMIVFVLIAGFMFLSAGINWKIISATIGCGLIVLLLFVSNLLPDFRQKRLEVLTNLEKFKDGAGWQQYRGQIALASGKIFGKGFLSDDMITDVPELYNDMIFAHVGQTLGMIGCIAVLVWLSFLCLRILKHGKNSPDNLGFLICVGCFSLIFVQSIINIGMVLVIAPVIGVTLPFISAGGSSNLSSYILLGIILSVQKHSFKPNLFE